MIYEFKKDAYGCSHILYYFHIDFWSQNDYVDRFQGGQQPSYDSNPAPQECKYIKTLLFRKTAWCFLTSRRLLRKQMSLSPRNIN